MKKSLNLKQTNWVISLKCKTPEGYPPIREKGVGGRNCNTLTTCIR